MSTDTPQTILVVEDEPALLRMLGVVLRHHGFAVRLAASGAEAVAAYREHGAGVSLVLLDVQMPGPDGPETLALLRQIDPEVRCCFMSGHTGKYSAEDLLGLGALHLFPKPLNMPEAMDLLWRLAAAACRKPVYGL